MINIAQGRMQDFSGGATIIFFWILDIHVHAAAAKMRAVARGVWGHAPQRKFVLNGAISCVLRAIFNHFYHKKSS